MAAAELREAGNNDGGAIVMLKNISSRPIMLRLSSGQAVRIQPGESVRVDAADLENPIVKELVRTGELEVTV